MRDNEKNNEKMMREEIKEFADKVNTDTARGKQSIRFVYGAIRGYFESVDVQKGGAV